VLLDAGSSGNRFNGFIEKPLKRLVVFAVDVITSLKWGANESETEILPSVPDK
jgi:hypothetical protein